jgi:hypothetical protein
VSDRRDSALATGQAIGVMEKDTGLTRPLVHSVNMSSLATSGHLERCRPGKSLN